MNQSAGAVAQIKKNALVSKGDTKAKSAPVKGAEKKEKAPSAPREPRQTISQKCESIAAGISWDDACKLTPKTEVMIYNVDQKRWQKAHFVHGTKDAIQAILAKNLFVIDRARWEKGNENGKGIIATLGKSISTPEINETAVRKAFIDHPDYRTLPVWKEQFKDMLSTIEKPVAKAPAKKEAK